MGGVASTASNSRHPNGVTSSAHARHGGKRVIAPTRRTYSVKRHQSGRGSSNMMPQYPSQWNPSAGPSQISPSGEPGNATYPYSYQTGFPNQGNNSAACGMNSLHRIGSASSLSRMNSMNSLMRMGSTNSLMRMGSTNSMGRVNSMNSLMFGGGSGAGADYFRDLAPAQNMGLRGSRMSSLMQTNNEAAPIGGSFYANLPKQPDKLSGAGGGKPTPSSYASFRNSQAPSASNKEGNRFAKPRDPKHPMANRRPIDGKAAGEEKASTLQRYDSTNMLQRQYSISGQFNSFNNMNPMRSMGPPPPGAFGSNSYRPGMCPPSQAQQNIRLNAHTGNISGPGANAVVAQAFEQRRLANDIKRRLGHGGMEGGPNSGIPNMSFPSSNPGAMPIGLERKDSQKRVGMYFKKVNNEKDGVEYRKEGEKREAEGSVDYKSEGSSDVYYVKPILLYDSNGDSMKRSGDTRRTEIDGCTVRHSRSEEEEIHKYDMSDIVSIRLASDVEVQSDSLDMIREHFVCGSNVSMIMADIEGAAADPPSWFSWLALKYVVKESFARLDETAVFTMSACLLQDDQVMDLFDSEGPPAFEPLRVAESPFFGNVAHGLTYILIRDAKRFNQSLDQALEAAHAQTARNKDDEQGIVLVTCLLKQIRTARGGARDVWISSIFASGVGDGIIHYNRILDKNPAEPRAVFYAALHRSVYSTAIFSASEASKGLYQCLCTLQRFRKVELRKPKVNSVSMFVNFSESTIAKMKGDVASAKNTPRYPMMMKFLEKMEVMLVDAKEILENPQTSVPKTYM